MNKTPKVSIIIPVYNGSNYLAEAINSALAQDYHNVEVVVINDGSTDCGETEGIAKSYGKKIRYFYKKNGGVATALNYGIRKMKGEWFSWLSHDDIYFPDKISRQIKFAVNYPQAKFIFSKDIEINEFGEITRPHSSSNWIPSKEPQIRQLLRANSISGCTTLIHKSVFKKVGLFNETNKTAQDGEMWIMISAYYKLYKVSQIVLKRRKHELMGSQVFAVQNKKDIVQTIINVEKKLSLKLIYPDRALIDNKEKALCHIELGDFFAKDYKLYNLAKKHYMKAAYLYTPFSKKVLLRSFFYSRFRELSKMIILLTIFLLILLVSDIILRPILATKLYYRPEDMFTNRYPPIPLLTRYQKNVSYVGNTIGDLSAMIGVSEYAEPRRIKFITDQFGFRNYPGASDKTIDIIILGDSFGAGTGTTQDKVWGEIIRQKFGFNIYNLSMPGGPWQELINLKIESENLKTNKNTLILWAIFSGNDLDDYYGDDLNPSFNSNFESFLVSLDTFRKRSSLTQLLHNIYIKNSKNSYWKDRINNVIIKDSPGQQKILFLNKYQQATKRTTVEISKHNNFEKLKKVFTEMKEFSNKKDFKVAVVSIPTKEEVYSWIIDNQPVWSSSSDPSAFSEVIKNLSQSNGFSFLDLKPFFVNQSKEVFLKNGKLLWWLDDTHWNEEGNMLAADLIYGYLIKIRL